MRKYYKYILGIGIFLLLSFNIFNFTNASTKMEAKISCKETKYKNDYINVDIKLPMLSYKKNINTEKRVNSLIEGQIISYKNQIEKQAKKFYEESQKENLHFIPFEAVVDYETTFINNKLLSLPINFYSYTGGAHGITLKEAYNFDLESGDRLKLNHIFKADSNYKDIIKEFIKTSIEENPDVYFDDAIDVINKLNDNTPFYITKNSLIIYYEPYEIAPYSSGIREFEIPFFTLSTQLNPKYSFVE